MDEGCGGKKGGESGSKVGVGTGIGMQNEKGYTL